MEACEAPGSLKCLPYTGWKMEEGFGNGGHGAWGMGIWGRLLATTGDSCLSDNDTTAPDI